MRIDKKKAPSVVGATKRAGMGANFARQGPTFNSTTPPGKIKGAGGARA